MEKTIEGLILETMKDDERNEFQLEENLAEFIEYLYLHTNAAELAAWQANMTEGRELLAHMQIFMLVKNLLDSEPEKLGIDEGRELPACNYVGRALGCNIALNMSRIFGDKTKISFK